MRELCAASLTSVWPTSIVRANFVGSIVSRRELRKFFLLFKYFWAIWSLTWSRKLFTPIVAFRSLPLISRRESITVAIADHTLSQVVRMPACLVVDRSRIDGMLAAKLCS